MKKLPVAIIEGQFPGGEASIHQAAHTLGGSLIAMLGAEQAFVYLPDGVSAIELVSMIQSCEEKSHVTRR